jgi:two-component system response regulator HydG
VNAVKEEFYDMILMDVRMTEMDGIEALEEIKKISPGIPVLMMTAYPSVPPAVKAMKLGALDYLAKPLDTDELRLRIAKLLGHHPLKEENQQVKTRLVDTSGLI